MLQNALRPLALTLGLTATLLAPVWAQSDAAPNLGEVRKIDKEAQKITLKHGELKSMDMPPMTMVFRVADPSLLDKVKPGDKVQFNAEKRDGAIVVTVIEPTATK
ncbi:copper-binding protein [Rhodoferax aquaticus]|uniref:Copper-binding protein n=2 Tax=Rhodoferax aquaticus TaxID=2527691 RepID=A0A515EVF4_9BURK|nr:copper-binding protein [Rhodoferax aquaticus]QDL56660.1 copper-binding protein [Rhodoferax aquaticus]